MWIYKSTLNNTLGVLQAPNNINNYNYNNTIVLLLLYNSCLSRGGRPKTNRRHHENATAEIVIAGGYVPDVSGLFSVFLIDNYYYYCCCIVYKTSGLRLTPVVSNSATGGFFLPV